MIELMKYQYDERGSACNKSVKGNYELTLLRQFGRPRRAVG